MRKACADVTRRKGRTLLAALGIALGVLGVTAVYEASAQLGGAFFYSTDATAVPTIDVIVDHLPAAVAATIRRLPAVQQIELRTHYLTPWQVAGTTAAATVQIYTVPTGQRGSFWPYEITRGRVPGRGEIVLDTRTLASAATLGDTLTVGSPGSHQISLRVVGLARTRGAALPGLFDNPIGYMSPLGLQQVTAQATHRPDTQILLRVPDARAVQTYNALIHILNRAQLTVSFSDWRYASGTAVLRLAVTGPLAAMRLLTALALLLVCVLLMTAVTTLLTEQITIIGTLKAMGGTRWPILRSYLVTVAIYSIIGTALGLPAGLLAGYQLAVGLASTVQSQTGQALDAGTFQVTPWVPLTSLIVGLLVPPLAALWPLWTGTRISVREAVAAYGVRSGRGGAGASARAWGRRLGCVPQTAWMGVRGLVRTPGRAMVTLLTLTLSGAIFLTVQVTNDSLGTLLTEQRSPIARPDVRVDLGAPAQPAIRAIQALPNVARIVPVAFADAILGQRRVFVTGVAADRFQPHLVAGRWLRAQEQGAFVLNAVAAQRLQLRVGQRVVVPLDLQTPSGQVETRRVAWTLVGLTHALDYLSGSADPNGTLGEAFTTLGTLNALTQQHADYADRLSVYAHDRSPRALQILKLQIARRLEQAGVQNAFVRTWQELSQGVIDPLPTIYALFEAAVLLVGLVGLLSLALTLAARVLERRREIGMLRALGATGWQVSTVFCVEALALAVLAWGLASIVGLPAGAAIVHLLGTYVGPFDLSIQPLLVPTMGLFVVVVGVVASVGPALSAAHVRIGEALRYE
jgi:putative ABC transport system permease protein